MRDRAAEDRFDLAFIDADKTGYPTYWAELVPRMRPGGMIAVDNVLRGGQVLHPSSEDAGRTTLWIQPAIPLRFVFSSAEPEALDRELIKQLAEDANTTGGMTLDARETARPLNAVPAAA